MHSGFQQLREHCPMDLVARTPRAQLAGPRGGRRAPHRGASGGTAGAGSAPAGPYLFGAFTAADAMYAPVASRFRTYVPDLAAYGDDGTAAAYVATLFAHPAMRRLGGRGARPKRAAADSRYRPLAVSNRC